MLFRSRDQFGEQFVLSEQVYTLLHEGEEDNADAEEEGPGTDTGDYDSAGTRHSRPQRRQRRRRRYAKKYSLAELARSHSIPGWRLCCVVPRVRSSAGAEISIMATPLNRGEGAPNTLSGPRRFSMGHRGLTGCGTADQMGPFGSVRPP